MQTINLALSTDEQGRVHLAVPVGHRNGLSDYAVAVHADETVVTVRVPGILASVSGNLPVTGPAAAVVPPRPRRR